MEYIEVSAKTIQDALTEASIKLGLTSDQVEYEVIEKGSTGFLGIGNKPAKIRARKKEEKPVEEETAETVEETKEAAEESSLEEVSAEEAINSDKKEKVLLDPKVSAREFLTAVLEKMEIEAELKISDNEEEECLEIDIQGKNMGILIGKRGQTLDSLQYLTSLVVNKGTDEYVRIKLDTENYRQRRKETLENLARNIAYKVKKTKRPVTLEPMNPYERRVIHYALQNDKFVTTHSEGEEPYRHVVVTLK
jgi:spoIIIJ-associated protein